MLTWLHADRCDLLCCKRSHPYGNQIHSRLHSRDCIGALMQCWVEAIKTWFLPTEVSLYKCLHVTSSYIIEIPVLENLALSHIYKNVNLSPELSVVSRETKCRQASQAQLKPDVLCLSSNSLLLSDTCVKNRRCRNCFQKILRLWYLTFLSSCNYTY